MVVVVGLYFSNQINLTKAAIGRQLISIRKKTHFFFTSSISMNSMILNRANITSGQKKTNSFTKLWRRAIYKKKERKKKKTFRLCVPL